MRLSIVPFLLTLSLSPGGQSGDPVAPYLSPQYTAAADASSLTTIAGPNEPGERLVVTGRTLDGMTPVTGVSLYVFHTDARGRYATDQPNGAAAELKPRLHGLLRTDAQGRYQYETIRPGFYNGPRHVHYVVIAPGYVPRLIDLWFDDDPMLLARRQAGYPVIDDTVRALPACRTRPDCVVVSPVSQDVKGTWHAIRDIQMVKE